MPHVGINAHLLSREASYRRAGIHVYITEILRHLPRDAGLDYTVFCGDPPDELRRLPHQLVGSRWSTARPPLRILWEQMAWPFAAHQAGVDLLHSMAFVTPMLSRLPAVVTVYDLSFIHYPDTFPTLQRLYLTSQTGRSCRAARRVIAISESGRDDIERLFGVPRERIDVAPPGLSAEFRPPEPEAMAAFRDRVSPPKRYILHVGTLQPRKNLTTLIDGLARLGQPDLHLVLIGGKGWLYDEIFARVAERGLTGRVHFPGYVADEDLPFWYHGAELFAFPSLYEGFGMPIVQAMACGTPVVASNVSAMPEAAGDAALLFDPHDSEALAECIALVLNNPNQAATMRERGLQQAARFTWQQAGRITAESYLKASAQMPVGGG